MHSALLCLAPAVAHAGTYEVWSCAVLGRRPGAGSMAGALAPHAEARGRNGAGAVCTGSRRAARWRQRAIASGRPDSLLAISRRRRTLDRGYRIWRSVDGRCRLRGRASRSTRLNREPANATPDATYLEAVPRERRCRGAGLQRPLRVGATLRPGRRCATWPELATTVQLDAFCGRRTVGRPARPTARCAGRTRSLPRCTACAVRVAATTALPVLTSARRPARCRDGGRARSGRARSSIVLGDRHRRRGRLSGERRGRRPYRYGPERSAARRRSPRRRAVQAPGERDGRARRPPRWPTAPHCGPRRWFSGRDADQHAPPSARHAHDASNAPDRVARPRPRRTSTASFDPKRRRSPTAGACASAAGIPARRRTSCACSAEVKRAGRGGRSSARTPIDADAQGRFTYARTCRPVARRCASATASAAARLRVLEALAVAVRARVSLSAVAAFDPLRVSACASAAGCAAATSRSGGKLVELQAFERGHWRSFRTVRTNAKGAFSYRYRFSFRASGTTFPVRARRTSRRRGTRAALGHVAAASR